MIDCYGIIEDREKDHEPKYFSHRNPSSSELVFRLRGDEDEGTESPSIACTASWTLPSVRVSSLFSGCRFLWIRDGSVERSMIALPHHRSARSCLLMHNTSD